MQKITFPGKFMVLFFAIYGILFLPYIFVSSAQVEPDLCASSFLRVRDNLIMFFTLFAQFILYIFFYRKFKKRTISFSWIVVFLLLIGTISLFIKPIGSSDLFSYISQVRVFSEYGQNPYLHSYAEFSNDVLFGDLNNKWSGYASPYGPLFVLFFAAISKLVPASTLFLLTAFKLFAWGSFVFCLYLLKKITNSSKALYLFVFNPLILFEVFVNAHNEIFLVMFLFLAIFLSQKIKSEIKKTLAVSACLAAGSLIKASFLIVLPVFLVVFWAKEPSFKKKVESAFLFVSFFVLCCFFFYLPFLSGENIFHRILSQAGQFNFLISSPLIFLSFLGAYIVNPENAEFLAACFSRAMFLLFFVGSLFYVYKKQTKDRKDETILLKGLILATAGFLFSFYTWFLPWYFILLLSLLVLGYVQNKKSLLLHGIFWLTFYGICFYLILD